MNWDVLAEAQKRTTLLRASGTLAICHSAALLLQVGTGSTLILDISNTVMTLRSTRLAGRRSQNDNGHQFFRQHSDIQPVLCEPGDIYSVEKSNGTEFENPLEAKLLAPIISVSLLALIHGRQ